MKEYFKYLDTLRASGVTNMFGAGAYLESVFKIDKSEAHQVLTKWMNTFDDDKSVEARVALANK